MHFRFLRCVAKAVVRNGVKLACGLVPGGGVVYEVAADAWEDYCQHGEKEALRKEIEALANASAEEVRQDVAAAVQAEAADQPQDDQQNLTNYLSQVPAAIRRSLRRPSDPIGLTVPVTLPLSRSEDLVSLLPSRLPRFKPGDQAEGIGDWELEELLGVGGFGEVWKARNT
jgi:eukaryotic-like serine/threonine-protein kinase